jgi:U3 small nucleolar RNA-associated protein 10
MVHFAHWYLQYDALRSRVADTNATVVEALYNDPNAVLPIFSNLQFIEAVSSALAAPGVSRSTMRLHFMFVAGDLSRTNPDLAPDIFEHIFLPYLLFTKSRQKTAALAWQSLCDSTFAQYELLRGCKDIVQAHKAADGASRSIEDMTTLNLAVTNCIAGEFLPWH